METVGKSTQTNTAFYTKKNRDTPFKKVTNAEHENPGKQARSTLQVQMG